MVALRNASNVWTCFPDETTWDGDVYVHCVCTPLLSVMGRMTEKEDGSMTHSGAVRALRLTYARAIDGSSLFSNHWAATTGNFQQPPGIFTRVAYQTVF